MTRPNFSDETKEELLEKCQWICISCGKRRVEDFHHKLNNSRVNQRKFKLFLQSRYNAAPLCRKCHEDGGIVKSLKISETEAQEWEDKLNGRE